MEIEEIRKSIAEKYKSKYNKDISNKELTDIFIRGNCFEFAYFYNKYGNSNSRVLLSIGIDKVSKNVYNYDIIHSFVVDEEIFIYDITGKLSPERLREWRKKGEGDDYSEIRNVFLGENINGEIVDEEFVINKIYSGDYRFIFSEDEWVSIFKDVLIKGI